MYRIVGKSLAGRMEKGGERRKPSRRNRSVPRMTRGGEECFRYPVDIEPARNRSGFRLASKGFLRAWWMKVGRNWERR